MHLPLIVCATLAVTQLLAQNALPPSTTYLQQASDRFQHTVDVYTDADAAGNHFAARGEFDSRSQAILVPPMDEISSTVECHSGITCITATFQPSVHEYGGWYFLNGTLKGSQGQPVPNWGAEPDAGYDLTGAQSLTFWARGDKGGEVVDFFSFGVGQGLAFPDSSPQQPTRNTSVRLTNTWQQYTIDLTNVQMSYVLGGFGWNASRSSQSNPLALADIRFYLDDIQFHLERPNAPRFLVSYEVQKTTDAFDRVQRNAAYIYDNALALVALTAAGDIDRARTIADAFLYAIAHDRYFGYARLRNAYQGGDIALPAGWVPNGHPNTVRMPGWYEAGTWYEDAFHVSTSTGNVAWTMLGLLYFYRATHEDEYLRAADVLGHWVVDNAEDPKSPGFTAGYEGWEGVSVPEEQTHVRVAT